MIPCNNLFIITIFPQLNSPLDAQQLSIIHRSPKQDTLSPFFQPSITQKPAWPSAWFGLALAKLGQHDAPQFAKTTPSNHVSPNHNSAGAERGLSASRRK
jgi:hypothetical protein